MKIYSSIKTKIHASFPSRLLLQSCLRGVISLACLALITIAVMDAPAGAQTSTGNTASPEVKLNETKDDTRYRIGPGDVVSIQVLKSPELSASVRVDQRGMIRVPMVDGDIFAACRTESELAAELRTLYLEYKKNPTVQVFVVEFQAVPVAVIGAVEKPGQFRLQRQVRLLELVSYAGGPTDKAGRLVNVIHTGGPSLCTAQPSNANGVNQTVAANPTTDDGLSLDSLGVFKLDETLKGKPGSNPFVQPGDIVSVPEADQVFVIGHVVQPRAIPLKDKVITVSKAIAMAGGAARDGKTSKVKILRDGGNGEARQEIFVDLRAIDRQKAPDVALLPNDIVEVGSSTGKTILGMLTGAAPAALSNSVIRVIP